MPVFSTDLKVWATAYIVADTEEEALAKLREHFKLDGFERGFMDLEVQTGVAGEFVIDDYQFDQVNEDTPLISVAPTMTVWPPDWASIEMHEVG